MYKIGIDARLYNQTGVGVYLQNLLYFLEELVKGDIRLYIYLLPEDYDKARFKNQYFIKKVINSRWHTFSEQIDFARTLYQDNLDLVHFTYFSYPVLYKKKFIATIHDTTPLFFKTGKASTKNKIIYELKFRAFNYVISQQVKNASKIITPTKTVKKQLVELFGKKYENKIVPIYEGVDYKLIETAKKFEILNSQFSMNFKDLNIKNLDLNNNLKLKIKNYLKKPFFIYIGNFYPHKNVERLIQAFAKIKDDVRLILVGPDDYFSQRLMQLIKQLNQKKRIAFYHNPSKQDLVSFYKNALALIHPSLSEGFGLPIVEAVYFKLPIIASNIEVFKELLNKKYVSFNPLSVEDIAKKIRFFLSQSKKIEYGNLLQKFSFESMIKETLILYQKMLA